MALSSTAADRPVSSSNRWLQIVLGVICMVAAANIQYAWTLFVPEIQKTFGWDRAAIQVAFTIFVVVQTWLTPIEGYFIDKYGPSRVVMFGGLMTGLAWVVNSYATSLSGFYLGSVLGGIGVGCVYATCINNALKWFPDKRGLAVGLTAGGYGAGSALTILPIAKMIDAGSYAQAFFTFGLIQGTVIILASIFMRSPAKDEVKFSTKVLQTRRDYTLGEALRTPVFYVMLLMFTCTVTGGLMAVAQLGVIATDLGVKNFQVNLYFFAMAALPFALMLDRIMNGISRPLFGWISDRIGREKTMFIAFSMEGIGIVALGYFGSNPWAFVILSGIVFLAWGEVYSLFSATAADTFGSKHIGKIYGVLYCAKGFAALFVPVGNLLMQATGTWSSVLYTVATMDLIAAALAVAVLRPMLKQHHAANNAAVPNAALAHA
ncbi:UNVERIFIED_CONTAM: oxalate/formate MFS antiporter [Methylobacteriaceae bacterium AG10]|jgi:MFS transporter, OFA family, oxalate/formate antiporter|uniref:Oxalate/formate MFS antiporter n=2 Tax=Methylorubrum podarium TaxID=200476 RepID=A0ABV1QVN4_9HYPH|nr:oxalate/formate MFS antiporter [Methylobacteriaceae bacterium AG10]